MKRIVSTIIAMCILISSVILCAGCNDNAKDDNTNVEEERKYLPVSEMSLFEKNAFQKNDHKYLSIDNSVDPIESTPVVVAEDGSFFDDFSTGIDKNIWEIAQKAWGGGNHGVLRSNVSYTADGIVVLTGNGDLYDGPLNEYADDELGLRSGACIVTKKQLGPGSYEAKVKVHPQMGACTAMWTFFWTPDKNHEIDIEIPASTKDFKKSQFVTWTTEEIYTEKETTPEFYHNDGNWHTYRFDWHTTPPHVDFYVDDKLEMTIDKDIPDTAGNLWLGVWFPKRWSGVPLFDTSYMLVDYFKYTAFDEPYNKVNKTFKKTPSKAYPTEPVDLPTCNFLSNAGFEYDTNTWKFDGDASIVQNPERNDYMLKIKDQDSVVKQIANSIVPNSEYTINFSACGTGKVVIECLDSYYSDTSKSSLEIPFDSKSFSQYTETIKVPDGCHRIQVALYSSSKKTAYYDDFYLIQPNRNDFNLK